MYPKQIDALDRRCYMGRALTCNPSDRRKTGRTGPNHDPRFALHQRQPRANKLDQRQRLLCRVDMAFAEALRGRVASPARFAAFLEGVALYVDFERPCARCGGIKRRTRDRSCYGCHLARSGANFERMKAGLSPVVSRNQDSLSDMQMRERAERNGESEERNFSGLIAKYWPTGRLEVTFPDGYNEPDMSKLGYDGIKLAITDFPQLVLALAWAGWTIPG